MRVYKLPVRGTIIKNNIELYCSRLILVFSLLCCVFSSVCQTATYTRKDHCKCLIKTFRKTTFLKIGYLLEVVIFVDEHNEQIYTAVVVRIMLLI